MVAGKPIAVPPVLAWQADGYVPRGPTAPNPMPPQPTQDTTAYHLRELGWSGGPLRIGGIPAAELVARFGSPLYVFDGDQLARRAQQVQTAFGPGVALLYSVKANPSVAVLQTLADAGCGAEIASGGELAVVQAAGLAPGHVQFAGPGKSDQELLAAAAAGLGCITVESAGEAERLGELAKVLGQRIPVALRITTPEGTGGGRLKMGGSGSWFGMDADTASGLLASLRNHPWLRAVGLHTYGGTQCHDPELWLSQVAFLHKRARVWEGELGLPPLHLNVGGGFAAPTFLGDPPPFDLVTAGEALQRRIAEDGTGRPWMVELGRYLTAPAGVFLTTVRDVKRNGTQTFAVLDGGSQHHSAAAGLGGVIKRNPPVVRVDAPGETSDASTAQAAVESVQLVGPLCTPTDRFGAPVQLGPASQRPIQPGDTLALLGAGAYGLTFSNSRFLSHPTPAEVMVRGGEAHLARHRGGFESAVRDQRPLA